MARTVKPSDENFSPPEDLWLTQSLFLGFANSSNDESFAETLVMLLRGYINDKRADGKKDFGW